MTEPQTHADKKNVLSLILRFLIPVAVTVGLCWLMFRNIDFRDMMAIIRSQCDFTWIVAGMLISAFAMVVRGLRWRIQLISLGVDVPRHVIIYSIFGTYAINLLVPRLGEVWRSGYIAQRQDAKFSTIFGSMLSERMTDTVIVLLFMVAAFVCASGALMSYLHENEGSCRRIIDLVTSPWTWVAVVVCIGAFVFLITRKTAAGSFIGKVQGFLRGIWQGFASLATMKGKGRWLGYTVLLWGCYFVSLWVAFYAFPFTTEVVERYGMTAVLVVYAISSLAMGVPSNGGIGPWQFAVIFGLGVYDVAYTDSAAFANLVLGCNTAMTILLGLYTFVAVIIDRRSEHN